MRSLLEKRNKKNIFIYVDASNIGSGGGINHLKNILKNAPPSIKKRNLEIHVWIKESIKNKLPQQRNLIYHWMRWLKPV